MGQSLRLTADESQMSQGSALATGSAAAASGMEIDGPDAAEPELKRQKQLQGWASSDRVGRVEATDSVARFARRHGCSYKEVAALNGFQMASDGVAPFVLYPGQVLQLPPLCK